ncbi:MAG: hypothetical protein U9O49_02225 [Candidatus Thermoplasmatota archaeon]|nr:hypothetical protein [Candidatus Thermoplasmatota archaeon]
MSKDSKTKMNEELQKWSEQSKNVNAPEEQKKQSEKGKPKGMCQICGKKTAKHVCLKCGKSVCQSCYFKIIGICKKCVQKDTAEKWDGSRKDWEKELGVEWVD